MDETIRWDCSPYSRAAALRLQRELGLSAPVASILVRRGHVTPAAAERFLRADERHDPSAFDGMDEACELVLRHVRQGSRIVVHGDYDVDGVASTAILVRALRRLGTQPDWHLPSRFDGGYGLSVDTVETLARGGAELLIAVDCGITSAPEIEAAHAAGIDAIVVDHHRPAERLPACPIVHPTVSRYPFGDLCAAGVALKLAQALATASGRDSARVEEDELDLVALATVADLVPLRGENRRLVREGLRALSRTANPGLRALMEVAGVDPGRLDAGSVGFRLAPRLNAAGRLGRADGALELLLCEDEERVAEIAGELDLLNRERRATELRILAAAEAARAEAPDAPALVLAGDGWHAGVIGIVASRLVERHGRPCVLIALDEGGGGTGSGRSVPAYDLHAGLSAASAHLRRFGGHRAAAGFELDREAVEPFRQAFLDHARTHLSEGDLIPVERVDAVVSATAVGLELAEELERLGPFGQGNPRPILLVPGARLSDVRGLGADGDHAAFTLTSGGARARVVAFGKTAASLRGCDEARHDVAARLELNEWNGAVEPRLALRGLRRTEPAPCRALGGADSLWDGLERELAVSRLAPALVPKGGARTLCDRRGEGFAGTAGDVLSCAEAVLVVCADVARRRPAVEELLGGLAEALCGDATPAELALVSWTDLERSPELAQPFPHLLALDPPESARGELLLAGAPGPTGDAHAYACWGQAEVDFATRAAIARLELRPVLAEVYRALRAGQGGVLAGDDLGRALCGDAALLRGPELCARVVRVLDELELARYRPRAEGGPACRLASTAQTELERSATYRASLARLDEARRYLAGPALRADLSPAGDGIERTAVRLAA